MRFITLNNEKVVTNVRHGNEVISNEVESETGNIGQLRQSNGSFVTPLEIPVVTETLEEKIDRLEQRIQNDNLIEFDVLATIYEELLNRGAI